jgi:hypothetical protein
MTIHKTNIFKILALLIIIEIILKCKIIMIILTYFKIIKITNIIIKILLFSNKNSNNRIRNKVFFTIMIINNNMFKYHKNK